MVEAREVGSGTESPEQDDIAVTLKGFGGDPQRASRLASFLGFEPIPNPQDWLAGPLSLAG